MGDKLIVSSHWDALVALDKNTGKEQWENKDEDIRFRSSTPAVVNENTLLVADSDAVMLVDANTGEITSKTDFEGYNFSSSAQPLVAGDIAYIPTANKGLVIMNLKNNEIVKEVQVGKAMLYTAPYTSGDSMTIESSLISLSDGSLLFGASDGKLYVMSADGEITKTYDIGAPIFGSAAEYNGNLIVSDYSGRVVCLDR